MQMATTRGVYVIKELTENTCEWTRAQQVSSAVLFSFERSDDNEERSDEDILVALARLEITKAS